MKYYVLFIALFALHLGFVAQAQTETYDIPMPSEQAFFEGLPSTIPNAQAIKELYASGDRAGAIDKLANYFKEKSSERFYFSWKNIASRMAEYDSIYPSAAKSHAKDASSYFNDFTAPTAWKLPFTNKAGVEMNAYAIRHLFRQHKAGDLAFAYYLQDKKELLGYFVEQVKGLNAAYQGHEIEIIADGNGAYEAFRGGNRMENWLLAHHLFLGSEDYLPEDQITLIRTFLHHAEVLYQTNTDFQYGNHQTKGMVALASIAMLYSEFDADTKYFDRAIDLLGQHLQEEINEDGFQFERSYHYHIGDIDNYFRVYKLAQLTHSPISKTWEAKLEDMFKAISLIAFPNGEAPVIQDDTDQPMATTNVLNETMALGYTLFQDEVFGYFASSVPSEEYYWLMSQKDIAQLQHKKTKKPTYKSSALTSTGYYVFRDGWNDDSFYMLISTGLSDTKPDHQHGDALGFQIYANGNTVLPNYQVRYPLPEYEFFKNSWVKNVALVDSIPQGLEWSGNQGGSGFGKFNKLPRSTVSVWEPKGNVQAFSATHDGYADLGVSYQRTIYFFPGEFWLVKDVFEGGEPHQFYQNFQGNYTLEDAPYIARANYMDASGLDIIQLNNNRIQALIGGDKGKNRLTYQSEPMKEFDFVSIIRPYGKYDERTSISTEGEAMQLGDWDLHYQSLSLRQLSVQADYIFIKGKQLCVIGLKVLKLGDDEFIPENTFDLLIEIDDQTLTLKSFDSKPISLTGADRALSLKPLESQKLNPNQ
ncbi:heparinase II/III family protein [Echinicola pacifica]|nr:heparinase II/III family protein [Echinicola pacifica]